ncbi:hypothetical protein A3Q56_00235 [Intoshia linei]|uniref:Uncharacterized protein n=1 Tax=Intoshia linei TaxID=1819745 RepID=A0A177BCD4_9BILA|nr:hypothetical protein A3Q56_00235 [Intoshia linei]
MIEIIDAVISNLVLTKIKKFVSEGWPDKKFLSSKEKKFYQINSELWINDNILIRGLAHTYDMGKTKQKGYSEAVATLANRAKISMTTTNFFQIIFENNKYQKKNLQIRKNEDSNFL